MFQRKIIIIKECVDKIKDITLSSNNLETGGLIYGRMNPNWVKVYDVSGPGDNASSSKYNISMDMNHLFEYSTHKLKQDFYIVGTWHSHPSESSLLASSIDVDTMIDFSNNYKTFYAPIFFIVGFQSNIIKYQLYEVVNRKVKKIEHSEGELIIE